MHVLISAFVTFCEVYAAGGTVSVLFALCSEGRLYLSLFSLGHGPEQGSVYFPVICSPSPARGKIITLNCLAVLSIVISLKCPRPPGEGVH